MTSKFYELSLAERLQQLGETGLTADDLSALSGESGLTAEQADHMIENVVGLLCRQSAFSAQCRQIVCCQPGFTELDRKSVV